MKSELFSEALDFTIANNMNGGFMKTIEQWLAKGNDISNNIIYSTDLHQKNSKNTDILDSLQNKINEIY